MHDPPHLLPPVHEAHMFQHLEIRVFNAPSPTCVSFKGFGFFFPIFLGHLVAIAGWGGANPVARRGYYREIVAKFGYDR
jgi:hypothetical protein